MEFKITKNAAVVPHNRHWQFCVGSGHALLALRTDYTRQLKFIHDTLGIRYVRFHGIFDDDMSTMNSLNVQLPMPGAEEFHELNFRACGVAYDNVLAAGMKPFVELSFMPRELAEDPDKKGNFYYKPIDCLPKDLGAWQEYIKAFIRFLKHRYGEEEIRTWYFEVWNEPDLNPVFFQGSRDDYFRLYAATARAIKEVDDKLRVGGPATSNSKWIHSFREFCESNDVPVDFFSTHQYAGDPLGGVKDQGSPDSDEEKPVQTFDPAKFFASASAALGAIEDKTFLNGFRAIMGDQSEDSDMPDNTFRTNVKITRKQAQGYPLFYTEWNENAGFSAYTNDTRKVAAYDVKNALAVGPYVDGSSIWCFSDIFEELHPFPQPFHGGFGILNQDGIPKPVYYALRMLANAGDERIDLGEDALDGEIGIAAFRGIGETQILLFRQKMKNDDAAEKVPADILLETDRKPSDVTVERIDAEHGNPLRIWEEDYNSRVDLNRVEIQDITGRSAVHEEEWDFTTEGNATKVHVELGVNDVYCIHVKA